MASSGDGEWPWKEPKNKISRGAFVVVEGLDRAGKTTQVRKLCDALYSEGHNVKTIRFPDRTTPMGKMIDSYLQSRTEMDDHTIHLLFSANRWEKAKWIEETLEAGYSIVCDRYYYSGIVYSTAKQNPRLSLEWARAPDVGLPRPDRVIFLDLDPEAAARRGGFGDEKYEKKEMQARVRQIFLELTKLVNDEGSDMKVLNAGKSIEEVSAEILADVLPKVRGIEASHEIDGELRFVKQWGSKTLSQQNSSLGVIHLPK